jgi:methyl acetate hydrolase
LAWAGLYNTFDWISPKNGLCAVMLMQFLPFVDKEAVGCWATSNGQFTQV